MDRGRFCYSWAPDTTRLPCGKKNFLEAVGFNVSFRNVGRIFSDKIILQDYLVTRFSTLGNISKRLYDAHVKTEIVQSFSNSVETKIRVKRSWVLSTTFSLLMYVQKL